MLIIVFCFSGDFAVNNKLNFVEIIFIIIIIQFKHFIFLKQQIYDFSLILIL